MTHKLHGAEEFKPANCNFWHEDISHKSLIDGEKFDFFPAGAYYPAQPQYSASVQPAPVMINPAQQQQQAPPPQQPPAQSQGPPKRERKPVMSQQ